MRQLLVGIAGGVLLGAVLMALAQPEGLVAQPNPPEYKVIADCFMTGRSVGDAATKWLNDDTRADWQFLNASMGSSGSLPCGMVVLRKP